MENTDVLTITMVDICGRSISMLKKQTAETSADSIKDVKKILEDEIAETLNLASVDTGYILYSFAPTAPPGYLIIEDPTNPIYMP